MYGELRKMISKYGYVSGMCVRVCFPPTIVPGYLELLCLKELNKKVLEKYIPQSTNRL